MEINNIYKKTEEQCIKQGHLSKDHKLCDIIKNDINFIESKGFTINQIANILEKVNSHFRYTNKYTKVSYDRNTILRKVKYKENWYAISIEKKSLFNNKITGAL